MYMRPQIVTFLTLVLFIVNSMPMLGQSSGTDSGPPPPAQLTPPELFIDSQILWLAFAGLLYGVFVIVRKRNAAIGILD